MNKTKIKTKINQNKNDNQTFQKCLYIVRVIRDVSKYSRIDCEIF